MGVDDWIAREGRTCPKCGADDCRRWLTQQAAKSLLPAYVIPEWKQKELDDDCAFTANACPTCKGKCCRDSDMGYRVEHMGAECYEHHCDDCHDGQVPAPDPRDTMIAELRAEVEGHRKAQAAVYLALGTDDPDRTKWPELIKAMRTEVEKLREAVATDDDLMDSLREYATEDMLKIKAMREAIAALPPTVFPEWAKARAACRKAAGLEED